MNTINNEETTGNNDNAPVTVSSLLDRGIAVTVKSGLSGHQFAPLIINSVIKDTRSGTTHYFKSFSKVVDKEHIATGMADDDVKLAVRRFFSERKVERVIDNLISKYSFSGPNAKFTKIKRFEAVSKEVGDSKTAMIICSLLSPGFIDSNLMADGDDFVSRQVYQHRRAEMDDIVANVNMDDLMQLVESSTMKIKIDQSKPNYTAVVAEEIGKIFYPVGRILNESTLYSDIIHDILLGIRAHVDDQGLTLDTSVDTLLRDRPEIADLATNLTFLMAALELPRNSVTRRTFEMHQTYIPLAVGLIKSSNRFVPISTSDFRSAYSVRQIRDLRGNIVAAVFHESARMEKAVTAVTADSDAVTQLAWNVRAPRDPIGSKLLGALGTLPNALTMDMAAQHAAGVLLNVTEQSVIANESDSGVFDRIDGHVFPFVLDTENMEDTMRTFAMMASKEVNLYYDSDSQQFSFGYVLERDEPHYVCKSGFSHGPRFQLSDPNEVILLMGDQSATNELAYRPQTIPEAVFDTRLIGISQSNFVAVNERFPFSTSVGEVAIHGKLRYGELVSLSSTSDIMVVVPEYNKLVAHTVIGLLLSTVKMIEELKAIQVYNNLAIVFERDLAYLFDTLTSSLGGSYISEFRKLIIDRVVSRLPHKESVAMRSRLSTQSYTAMIDVQALGLVLERVGVVTRDECRVLMSIAELEPVKANLIEIGRRTKK